MRNTSVRTQLNCPEETLTIQAPFTKNANINNIITKFTKGIVSGNYGKNPIYGDFSDPEKYQNALDRVSNIKSQFETLTAEIRGKFNNDPLQLIKFLADPKNEDEAIKLKLRPPKTPKQELQVPPAVPPATPPATPPAGGSL